MNTVTRLILCIFLCTTTTAIAAPHIYGTEPVDKTQSVRGLEGLNLDLWTLGFFSKYETEVFPDGVLRKIIAAYVESQHIFRFYGRILSYSLNYSRPEHFERLVAELIEAKQLIGHFPEEPRQRPALNLLSTLIEETLFVMHHRFPDHVSHWNSVFVGTHSGNCLRMAKMGSIEICQGDVVLTKGSQGSSSFLARIADTPGNYSHSKTPYIDPQTGDLFFIESLIEDGVKLRPYEPQAQPPKKMAIYRLHHSPHRMAYKNLVTIGVDRLVDKMHTQTSDIINEASYPYDFLLDGHGRDQLFCSETSQWAHELGGAEQDLTPYPRLVWSQVTGLRKDLFHRFFNIQTDAFPAPSDVAFNSSFELVAVTYDLPRLEEDRIDTALIDSMIYLLEKNEDFVRRYLKEIESLGNQPITQEQLRMLKDLLPPEWANNIEEQIPADINFKQLLFFSYLNYRLTPMIRGEVQKINQDRTEQGQVPLGPSRLRQIIYMNLEDKAEGIIQWIATFKKAGRS